MAYACSLLHDRSAAEDVVHDCYVRLLKKAETYNLPADGTKILFQAITNACIDKNHRERRLLSLDAWGVGESERGSETLVSPGSNPIDLAVQRELEEALAESLQALPLSQRAAIELKGLGYSLEDIGEALGTSAGNAGVLVYRARKTLALKLTRFLEFPSDEPT